MTSVESHLCSLTPPPTASRDVLGQQEDRPSARRSQSGGTPPDNNSWSWFPVFVEVFPVKQSLKSWKDLLVAPRPKGPAAAHSFSPVTCSKGCNAVSC